jgi:hypothetical protein
MLHPELAKHLNTKVIDISFILSLVKFHDFRLCISGVMFFKCGCCYSDDALDSSRLVQFLSMLKVKLVSPMNRKVVESFGIFPTAYSTMSYLKYNFRYMLLKWVVGFCYQILCSRLVP